MNCSIPIYKIVVLGQGRVGKTSLTLKFVKNQFNDSQESSINACYLQKNISLTDTNKIVKLSIWDTAGQEKYNAVAPVYYRDAIGAIVVYQITSAESFERVKKWVQELREHANNKEIVIIIAGNKCDMQTSRRVTKQQPEKFAKEKGVNHILVSAKSGYNVNQLFKALASQVYHTSTKSSSKSIENSRRSPHLRLEMVSNSEPVGKDRKSCC